jgi:hypothetical protein
MHGREEKCIQVFCGKARRKETTRKSYSRSEDIIKVDLGEIGWDDMEWIDLA